MNFRIDRLLATLRDRPDDLLAAIDSDPLLIKREVNGLVLANASKELFSPQLEHQLFAKGIVYRRDPYRLVSLPLLKIFNLGEREVTVRDIAGMIAPNSRAHFLRKFDGTMIQRFQHDGKVFFSTRGMLDGFVLPMNESQDEDAPERAKSFDYLGSAWRIAREKYPVLADAFSDAENVTLVLELLHPDARVITDYKGRRDLVLLAVFDRERHAYWPYSRVQAFASRHGLTAVCAFAPPGDTIADQIDALLASLAGTDEEGTVLVLEHGEEVVYRVKVKSQDYLRLLKMMVRCTFPATVEMLDAYTTLPSWGEFEEKLKSLGADRVPEEVLGVYRQHYDAFAAYIADCERLRAFAQARSDHLRRDLNPGDPRAARKLYAQRAQSEPFPALLFSAFDARLNLRRVREIFTSHLEVREALRFINT